MIGLLDREGAAKYLSCTARHVDDLRRGGLLVGVLEGRAFRYRLTHLDAYIESLPTSAEVRGKSRWDRDRPAVTLSVVER